jgi:hypothetical protein
MWIMAYDPARGGGLLLPALAYLRLPAGPHRVVDFRGDVGAGVFAGAAPVAVDGVGGDTDLLDDGLRAAELPDQVADLALERLRWLCGTSTHATDDLLVSTAGPLQVGRSQRSK